MHGPYDAGVPDTPTAGADDPVGEPDRELDGLADDNTSDPAPRPVASRKRRRGGGGGVMAAAMLGLRDVFEEPVDDEIAIVIDDDEALRDADGMSVRLDPESPPKSRVHVHDPPRSDGSSGLP